MNNKMKKLKKISIVLLLFNSLFTFSQIYNGTPSGREIVPSSNEKTEKEFLIILNKARKSYGLQILTIDYDLTRAARYHSYDMYSQKYLMIHTVSCSSVK